MLNELMPSFGCYASLQHNSFYFTGLKCVETSDTIYENNDKKNVKSDSVSEMLTTIYNSLL